jgi:DNA-binding beta-propeller fold protein YncE
MHVASGSNDGTIRLWDSQSGHPVGSPLKGHTGTVSSVAFSPDGAHLASGGVDNTIRLWDLQTRQPVQLKFNHTNSVSSMAIFPDGQRLVSATFDNAVQIWNTNSRELISALPDGNMAGIQSITVSPDGGFIAAADSNGRVCIWDAETYQHVSHGETSVEGLGSLSFSSNGTALTMSRIDGSVSRWKFGHGKLSAASTTSDVILPQNQDIMSLDRKNGWKRGIDDSQDDVLLRWLSSNDPDVGVWAFVNGKVIRSTGVDSVTISDVSGDPGEESVSA